MRVHSVLYKQLHPSQERGGVCCGEVTPTHPGWEGGGCNHRRHAAAALRTVKGLVCARLSGRSRRPLLPPAGQTSSVWPSTTPTRRPLGLSTSRPGADSLTRPAGASQPACSAYGSTRPDEPPLWCTLTNANPLGLLYTCSSVKDECVSDERWVSGGVCV